MALNTGFTRSITDAILHRLRWDDRSPLIDQVICSDEVARGRPSADMIQVLMDNLGIDSPARVLKVGDTEVDVEEGRNAACGRVGWHPRYPFWTLLFSLLRSGIIAIALTVQAPR